jgi:hypothetical protein
VLHNSLYNSSFPQKDWFDIYLHPLLSHFSSQASCTQLFGDGHHTCASIVFVPSHAGASLQDILIVFIYYLSFCRQIGLIGTWGI